MSAGLPDQAARDEARLDLGSNVIVEAGAGTGKTTLLIDRIVFLILGRDRGLDMSRLVALTFTEKAAAEIKFRLAERLHVLSRLVDASAPSPPDDESGAAAARRCLDDLRARFRTSPADVLSRSRDALRDIERAQIGTIHSFCAHLLRLYPLEAGLDPEFLVDADESALDEVFELRWALWLDGELGERPPREALWRSVLARASLGDLRDLARGLLNPRVRLDRDSRGAWTSARLRSLSTRAAELGAGRPRPRGGILSHLRRVSESLAAAAAACAEPKAGVSAPAGGTWGRRPKWPANWDDSGRGEYEELDRVARRVRPENEELLRRAVELVRPFAAAFRDEYRRRGWTTFDGLLIGARDLLRGHRHVRRGIKRRFDAVLIDEFQDTDPVQGELLMFLAERPGDGAARWRDVKVEPGRLFVVGDPKQSIYRFRGADIAAVESFTGHLEAQGARRCALQTNFRSGAGIVDAVNVVFDSIMKRREGLQPAYRPILASPGAGESGRPQWLQVVPPESEPDRTVSAEESRAAEAAWIARWILSGRGRLRLRDIAVVLRSTTSLAVYLEALKHAGIPYVVEGEKYFYETQEVSDFLNLLRAIDDPTDRVALAGLLRSPLVGLEDRRILSLSRRELLDYRKRVRGLERFYGLLRRLHARAGREPLDVLLRAVLRDTFLVELSAGAYHHQQTASNLMKFGRLASEACDRGMTLKEFIASVSRSVREFREEGESPLADEDYDAVRVLTIHKAKGLEYPAVILPNLSGGVRGGLVDAAVRAGWGDDAGSVWGLRLRSAGIVDSAMALLEEEELRRQREEEVRVLYVAMTRPKERLLLLGNASWKGSTFSEYLDRAGSISPSALPVDSVRRGLGRRRRAAWRPPDPRRLAAAWRRRRRLEKKGAEPLRASPPSGGPRTSAPSSSGSARTRAEAAFLGRLAHEVLERWDFAANRPLRGGTLGALIRRRADVLARERPGIGVKKARAECSAMLRRFLRSGDARELSRAVILGREVPFMYHYRGRIVRGVMDVVYRMGDRLIVGDYKTDRGSGAAHARQGSVYVRAVEAALGGRRPSFKVIRLRGAG